MAAALPFSLAAASLPNASLNPKLQAPIKTWDEAIPLGNGLLGGLVWGEGNVLRLSLDRKSTRLNSSHLVISYAVFCLNTHWKVVRLLPVHTVHARIARPHLVNMQK